jgi:hypothetical protein
MTQCKECGKEAHHVTQFTTLMGFSGGEDPNIKTDYYRCTDGHEWGERTQYGKPYAPRPYVSATDARDVLRLVDTLSKR